MIIGHLVAKLRQSLVRKTRKTTVFAMLLNACEGDISGIESASNAALILD